jgi:membrane-associated protease RseP (regulator of RpoE activity)
LTVPLKLAAAPEIPPRDALTIKSRSPFEGAQVMNMSPAVAEELSLEGASQGVVVAAVGDNSTAAQVGVQKGDVVVAVNGQKIATTRDLEKACAERAQFWDLTIRRTRRADDPQPTRRIQARPLRWSARPRRDVVRRLAPFDGPTSHCSTRG